MTLPPNETLVRLALIHEELHEVTLAFINHDYVAVAHEVIDLMYVVAGLGVVLGLPLEQLWAEVHRANMSKSVGRGKRSSNDIIKGAFYRKPEIQLILERAGMRSHLL